MNRDQRRNTLGVKWGEREREKGLGDVLLDASPSSIHVRHTELIGLEPIHLFHYFNNDKLLKKGGSTKI
jgi:hypothetical protein